MGLKSGSRDSGLDDADETEDGADDAASDAGTPDEAGSADAAASKAKESATGEKEMGKSAAEEGATGEKGTGETGTRAASDDATAAAEEGDDRPSMNSIPYKLRRNKVNEGREQVPYFLREDVIEGEEELQDTLEEALGETVYKSDYREAAMVVAQRNPELIADVLREWGYDLDAT